MTNALTLAQDLPAKQPQFGFDRLAEELADVLAGPHEAAFVLGLHGAWGSGKTTLMDAIERRLAQNIPRPVLVPFNAWKYQEKEALWRALILRMIDVLREEVERLPETGGRGIAESHLREVERSLYASFTARDRGSLHLDWTALATEAVLTTMRAATGGIASGLLETVGNFLSNFFGRKSDKPEGKPDDVAKSVERFAGILRREVVERPIEQVASIEQFLARFRSLVEELGKEGRRIYVFIDDLDRCLPESALDIFEAIKLFLDAPECRYVMALDRAVIRRALAVRYEKAPDAVDPDEYIEKTISLSFDLPILQAVSASEFLSGLSNNFDDGLRAAVLNCLGENPRRLERFANSLLLSARLAGTKLQDSSQLRLFVKFNLLAYRNSTLFEMIAREPMLAVRLQSAEPIGIREEKLKSEPTHVVDIVTNDARFWLIMALAATLRSEEQVRQALAWFAP